MKKSYVFRNFPESDDNCWMVMGRLPTDTSLSILEWCPSKKDAEIIMDSISLTGEFTDLVIKKKPLVYVLNANQDHHPMFGSVKFRSRRALCQYVANLLAMASVWGQKVTINDQFSDESIIINDVEYSLQKEMTSEGGLVTWMKSHLRSEKL